MIGPAPDPGPPDGPTTNPAHAPPQQPPPYPEQVPSQPPQMPGVNGFAIASLIFAVCGGLLFSVIFGIVALVQIGRRPQRGKGLAIAALIISGLWVAGLATAVVVAIATEAKRDSSGEITTGGAVTVTDLAVGDCVNGLKESEQIRQLPAVPCAQPHDGEVYAIFKVTSSTWPGDQAVADEAQRTCSDRLESYAAKPADLDSLELYFLVPTAPSWRQGDRSVTCIAYQPGKQRTGSLRDK